MLKVAADCLIVSCCIALHMAKVGCFAPACGGFGGCVCGAGVGKGWDFDGEDVGCGEGGEEE